MARLDDLGVQARGAGDGRVEVVDLEPEEHAIAVRERRITHRAVVVLDVPAVQLKNQPAM